MAKAASSPSPQLSDMNAQEEPLLYPVQTPTIIVLPLYRPVPYRRRRSCFPRFLLWFSIALLAAVASAAFFLWPSDPELQLARLRVNHVRAHTFPRLVLDLSLSVTLHVRNRDFFTLDYQSLDVSIGYRGRPLGFVNSEGGRLKARGSSYIEAQVELNGLEIVHDAVYLLEDLARGVLPFDTHTAINGDIELLFLEFPFQGRVSCEVYVNMNNQTITHQDCHPE